MDPTRRQFSLCYAVMGAVLAYLPELLHERLGSKELVGYIMATTGVAVIITPVIMTALADTHLQSRTIIGALFAVSGGACLWLAASDSFTSLLLAFAVFAFVFWPQSALQDGLVFARNRERTLRGEPAEAYHRIRVWGTFGFALPLIVIYFLLDAGMGLSVTVLTGAVVCLLGSLNATTLPRIELGEARRARLAKLDATDTAELPPAEKTRLPTLAAAKVLFRGPGLIFCIGMFFVQLPNAAYYAFYPVYLTDQVGFAEKWIGPIVMTGVILELGVMMCVGRMTRLLGLKWLLVVGLSCMVLRFALLGFVPTPLIAAGTQVFHGITVIAMYVIPPIYLNTLAKDHFRSSVQGLYLMAVFGPARIIGPIFAGWLGDLSLLTMFKVSASITLGATLMLACFLRIQRERPPSAVGGQAT